MLYEATIQFTEMDGHGADRVKKEKYVVEEGNFFANAENKMYEEFSPYHPTDFDVIDIKRSKIREFANDKEDDGCLIFLATIADIFIDENGDGEKETKYAVALFAHDIKEAHKVTDDYMRQGLNDMRLKGLKETKFIDFIK